MGGSLRLQHKYGWKSTTCTRCGATRFFVRVYGGSCSLGHEQVYQTELAHVRFFLRGVEKNAEAQAIRKQLNWPVGEPSSRTRQWRKRAG